MKRHKIVLLGLLVDHSGRKSPCLAIYNLKAYALKDAALRDSVDIKIYEQFVYEDPQKIINLLKAERPDVVALSCYLWSTDKLLASVNEYYKSHKDVLVFLGGPDAAPNSEKLFNRYGCISGIIKGEGEESFRRVLTNIVNNEDWKKTSNLICKINGELVINPKSEELVLADIPLAFKLEEFVENHGHWLYVETARGCKYRCAYCNFYNMGAKRRIREFSDIKNIVEEFFAEGGTDITFIDPGFNQDHERFHKVIKLLSDNKKVKVEGFEINIEELEDEDIKILAQITKGSMLGVGLQTTNSDALRIIGRAYNKDRFKDRINKLREVGIDYAVDMIFGLPGDNYESFKKTYDDANSLKPIHVRIYNLLILPDTRLSLEAGKYGLVFDPDAPYTARCCSTFSEADMKKANRFSLAHSIMCTYSSNSIAMSLLAEEVNESPSGVIEDFLKGAWKGDEQITDEDLERWKTPGNADERAEVIRKFINHKIKSKCGEKLPHALSDLFELQFQTGATNVSIEKVRKNKRDVDLDSESVYGLYPVLNNKVKILRLKTDVINTFNNRPKIKDVKVLDNYILVLFRTDTAIKYYKISPGIEYIFNKLDGKTSYGEIMADLLKGDRTEEQRNGIRKKINKELSELTKKQVLIWD